MSDELDLRIVIPTSEELLKLSMQQGKRFFSRREVAQMLGITPGQAGDLMKFCRLDAFWIGGEYRAPWTAIASFLEDCDEIQKQYRAYLSFTQPREIRPFWKVRRLMQKGMIEKARILLERQHAADWLILAVSDRVLPSKNTAIQEDDIQDWYDIPGMDLPTVASCLQWARLIGTRPSAISSSPHEKIEYPQMFDWLMEREIVNLPVFRNESLRDRRQITTDPQLSLF